MTKKDIINNIAMYCNITYDDAYNTFSELINSKIANTASKVRYLKIELDEGFFSEILWDEYSYDYDDIKSWKEQWHTPLGMEDGKIQLIIDVFTGEVVNLIDAYYNIVFFHTKVVDSGTYSLLDKDMNLIHEYRGYVPSCLEINDKGFGDYIEMEIYQGNVVHWKWNEGFEKEIMNSN